MVVVLVVSIVRKVAQSEWDCSLAKKKEKLATVRVGHFSDQKKPARDSNPHPFASKPLGQLASTFHCIAGAGGALDGSSSDKDSMGGDSGAGEDAWATGAQFVEKKKEQYKREKKLNKPAQS